MQPEMRSASNGEWLNVWECSVHGQYCIAEMPGGDRMIAIGIIE